MFSSLFYSSGQPFLLPEEPPFETYTVHYILSWPMMTRCLSLPQQFVVAAAADKANRFIPNKRRSGSNLGVLLPSKIVSTSIFLGHTSKNDTPPPTGAKR